MAGVAFPPAQAAQFSRMQGLFRKGREPAATGASFCTAAWNHRSGASSMYVCLLTQIQYRSKQAFFNSFVWKVDIPAAVSPLRDEWRIGRSYSGIVSELATAERSMLVEQPHESPPRVP